MQKTLLQSLCWAALLFVSACGNMPIKDIESHSYPGYCKNDSGQDLTIDQCNQKMLGEVHSKPQKTESESMIQHINEDIKAKK